MSVSIIPIILLFWIKIKKPKEEMDENFNFIMSIYFTTILYEVECESKGNKFIVQFRKHITTKKNYLSIFFKDEISLIQVSDNSINSILKELNKLDRNIVIKDIRRVK